jgi:hypothetical protein
MAILNYTSIIEPEQTIGEIQKMLSRHNVSAMMTEYDGPHVSAVSFRLNIEGRPMSFQLPCNWRAVLEVFHEQGITSGKLKHKDRNIENQAIRTAWRVIRDWIEAQLALVEINMVTVPQIFLPYVMTKDGKTLYEKMVDSNFLLGSGE